MSASSLELNRARRARARLMNALLRIPAPVRKPASKLILRSYEVFLAWRAERADNYVPPDGLPLPPGRLRIRMGLALGAQPTAFLDGGRRHQEHIAAMVDRAGGLAPGASVLDFGCGCGRVARWWAKRDVRTYGCDPDAKPAAWCDANLPMDAVVSNMTPPLPYETDKFDLIYALSVVTHFPEELERDWLAELGRILKPGGLLWFTTMGEWYVERLTPEQQASFRRGERVTRFEEVAGTNLCAAWHPPSYVRSVIDASGFELVEFAEGREDVITHDSWLVRRR